MRSPTTTPTSAASTSLPTARSSWSTPPAPTSASTGCATPPRGGSCRPGTGRGHAADLGQPHRRRHVLGGRDHRVCGLRRRPHAVGEQPAALAQPTGDNDGPGALVRSGIAALDPYSGVPLSWNPGRDRGRGVEALHATDEYLMVGSDTPYFAGQLRQRLAMLPVAGGTVNPAPRGREAAGAAVLRDRRQAGCETSFDGRSFGVEDHGERSRRSTASTGPATATASCRTAG